MHSPSSSGCLSRCNIDVIFGLKTAMQCLCEKGDVAGESDDYVPKLVQSSIIHVQDMSEYVDFVIRTYIIYKRIPTTFS